MLRKKEEDEEKGTGVGTEGDEDEEPEEEERIEDLAPAEAKVPNGKRDEIQQYRKEARRFVTTLRLIPEPQSFTLLAEDIRTTETQAHGDESNEFTLIFYNTPLSGESITNPRTRKPPFCGHYNKMLNGALAAYAKKGELPNNLVFVIFDGGREGDAAKHKPNPRIFRIPM